MSITSDVLVAGHGRLTDSEIAEFMSELTGDKVASLTRLAALRLETVRAVSSPAPFGVPALSGQVRLKVRDDIGNDGTHKSYEIEYDPGTHYYWVKPAGT